MTDFYINPQHRTDLRIPAIEHAEWGQQDALIALIRAGADLNVQDRRGNTPFQVAFRAGAARQDIARCLMAAGADLTVRNHDGQMALDHEPELGGDRCVDLRNDIRRAIVQQEQAQLAAVMEEQQEPSATSRPRRL